MVLGARKDLGFGGTQGSGGLFLLAIRGVQQSLRPSWPSEPRKGGHSRAQGGPCRGLGRSGPGLQAALEPFPAFLASPWKAELGGEGRGGAGRGGSESDPWPCLAPGAWQRVTVGGRCRFWGKKGLFHRRSALPGLCRGAAGAGGAGGLRGAGAERAGVMEEASRGLSKGSLKRFLGVFCHPGASPAPALAAGGSCGDTGTNQQTQTPLFSAAPGSGGAGAGSEPRSRCPGRNRAVPAGRHRFPFPWERVFWVRAMWRERAPLRG